MSWSAQTTKKVQEIRKNILKKKILLSIIIDNYAWWDKIYRRGHLAVAVLAPFFAIINETASDHEIVRVFSILFGASAAAMIKIKDYIAFDKLRDSAKEQTIRYTKLFDRIERELLKSDDRRQNEEDFLHWVIREYSQIELSDPDPEYAIKKKFEKFCKEKNIPFEDEVELLEAIIREEAKDVVEVIVDNNVKDDSDSPAPTEHRVMSLSKADPEVLAQNKKLYKESLRNINPTADMQWTMDRLSGMKN